MNDHLFSSFHVGKFYNNIPIFPYIYNFFFFFFLFLKFSFTRFFFSFEFLNYFKFSWKLNILLVSKVAKVEGSHIMEWMKNACDNHRKTQNNTGLTLPLTLKECVIPIFCKRGIFMDIRCPQNTLREFLGVL